MSRQRFVRSVVSTTGLVLATAPIPVHAESIKTEVGPTSTQRPFAPVEALVPAVRVRRVIDEAVTLAHQLVQADESSPLHNEILHRLESVLLQPQNFTGTATTTAARTVPPTPARAYLDAYTYSRESLALLAQPGAALVQRGEIDTWRRLKRQEQQCEQDDAVRAALNIYTSALVFSSSSYVLNVPKKVQSAMVRNDELPNVLTQVIASDMGLRYLYRNNVLTNLDEARAELRTLVTDNATASDSESALELLTLLQQAQEGIYQWFSLIDEREIQDAVAVAQIR